MCSYADACICDYAPACPDSIIANKRIGFRAWSQRMGAALAPNDRMVVNEVTAPLSYSMSLRTLKYQWFRAAEKQLVSRANVAELCVGVM
jgi:hypothetical protein